MMRKIWTILLISNNRNAEKSKKTKIQCLRYYCYYCSYCEWNPRPKAMRPVSFDNKKTVKKILLLQHKTIHLFTKKPEAEFKEFEPRLKYGWLHLNLY